MARGDDRDFADVPDRPSPVSLYPWLLIAWSAGSDTIGGKLHPGWLAAGGLVAFAGLYAAAIWLRWRTSLQRAAYLLLTLLGVVTVSLNLGFGPDMTALFPLLTIACGAVVPWVFLLKNGHGPPLPLLVVFLVGPLSALIAARQGSSVGTIWSAWYGPVLSGLIVAVIYRFLEAVAELRRTREELARSAVDAERLRFARDMHDLLGHTLSVMVVKAQAARKLASRDPALAAQQAMDIEEIGRGALTEVREAIAGYRGRGLTRELAAARTGLADAGVTVTVRQDGPSVPTEADTLLGWVVREGATNIIRHSGGHKCEIEVRSSGESVTVTIRDNGSGAQTPSTPPSASGGHGIDGLRERLAADGGTLEAGPQPGGGFRLAATVPLPVPARKEAYR